MVISDATRLFDLPESLAHGRWRDGRRFGEVQAVLHIGDDGTETIEIVDAAPRIAVTDGLVHRLDGPAASTARPIDVRRVRFDRWALGEYVTFVGADREVLYRVVDRDIARLLWLLEWPD